MNIVNFIEINHPDGSVEYVHKDYDAIMAQATASVPTSPIPQDLVGLTPEQLQAKIQEQDKNLLRQQRNKLLLECDWTQGADSPLAAEQKTAWATYRQQLRDITDTYTYTNVVWPIPPNL